jgi:hypothetical protein
MHNILVLSQVSSTYTMDIILFEINISFFDLTSSPRANDCCFS